MNYDWIMFDADGTLLDYVAAETHALTTTLRDAGLPIGDETTAVYQRINRELWAAYERGETAASEIRVARWVGLLDALDAEHDAVELAEAYISHLAASAHLLPGALETVVWFAQRARIALITNGLADVQRSRLAVSGLEPLLDAIVISDEIGVSKPSPAYFAAAFASMDDPDPTRCLVVGDNVVADIGGGASAGCDTAWINPDGISPPSGVSPTYAVTSVTALPDLVMSSGHPGR